MPGEAREEVCFSFKEIEREIEGGGLGGVGVGGRIEGGGGEVGQYF